jgi:2-C-methyl-D-erythritol 4-phosphate cytidylyltransferase
MSAAGIVVAAGRGERFGGPKAETVLAGRPLWQWARDALESAGVGPIVVVGAFPGGIPGGRRRRDSVRAGLDALPAGTEHVLIHDAARPLASPGLVAAVVERLIQGDADAVVPGTAIRDTLKRVEDGRVAGTVQRQGIVAAQTPQGFVLDVLVRAHAASGLDATDDAELVERLGGKVVVIEGEEANLKITFPTDLRIAEALAP